MYKKYSKQILWIIYMKLETKHEWTTEKERKDVIVLAQNRLLKNKDFPTIDYYTWCLEFKVLAILNY